MITVTVNKPKFEYDIHSLIKAFYPSEEVKVILDSEGAVQADFSVEYCDNCFRFRDFGG